MFLSFTGKYAVPPQMKPRILELSIRISQSNFSTFSTFFLSCEEEENKKRRTRRVDVLKNERLNVTNAIKHSHFFFIFLLSVLYNLQVLLWKQFRDNAIKPLCKLLELISKQRLSFAIINDQCMLLGVFVQILLMQPNRVTSINHVITSEATHLAWLSYNKMK